MDCMTYILTNRERTVFYVGVTSDPARRILEHKTRAHPNAFSSRYNTLFLVWYGMTDSISEAIGVEKRIKAGRRAEKITLIDEMNPEWRDLSCDFLDEDFVRDCHALRGYAQGSQ